MFRVSGLGLWVSVVGVEGSRLGMFQVFRVSGFKFRGSGFRVPGFRGSGVVGSSFGVPGFGV